MAKINVGSIIFDNETGKISIEIDRDDLMNILKNEGTKKYELLKDDTILNDGRTLYRIRALKDFGNVEAGELGGYIEKEENLSHEGNCWVYNEAKIYDNARVYGNAKIYDHALVLDNAKVYGGAKVFNHGFISGDAKVYNNAKVYDNTSVFNEARICGNAILTGYTKVYCNAKVEGGSYNSANLYFKR